MEKQKICSINPQKYLMKRIKGNEKLIGRLSEFYEATMDALSLQSKGHSNGWSKVQKLADKIEDEYCL